MKEAQMNRYTIDRKKLDKFRRLHAWIPSRANTARLIVVPAETIIQNTAALPGCSIDRVFYTISDYSDFVGDRAFILLRE